MGYVGWRVGGVCNWLVTLVKIRSRMYVHSMADNACTCILSIQQSGIKINVYSVVSIYYWNAIIYVRYCPEWLGILSVIIFCKLPPG